MDSALVTEVPEGALESRVEAAATATAGTLEVRTGNGLSGLLALRDDWSALIAAHPGAGFHHAFGWYLSYLRHLEHDPASVHFFSFFRGGRPVAIFPLRRVRRTAFMGVPSLLVWELPLHAHMDICDVIVAPHEDGAPLLSLLADTLRQRNEPWDVLHLPNLLGDAFALRALWHGEARRTLVTRNGRSMSFRCQDPIAATIHFTREFKRNLRRQRRRLCQMGSVETKFLREPAELDNAFAEFLKVEASGWKGSNGTCSAIALRPQLVHFYREILEHFGAQRRCLISLLKLDGAVIAAQFGLVAGRTLYLLKVAYDETYRCVAPGNLLLDDAIRFCCAAEELDRLSLTTGPAWAAQRWNPDVHDVWNAYVFNSSARGLAACAAAHVKSAVVDVVRSVRDGVASAEAAESPS